jgi:DICT domain-containing protein
MLGQPSTLSLFQLLHERLEPRLPAVRCTRTTLLHLSYKLEDLIRSHQIPAFLFTGFQTSQVSRQEIDRYQNLAQVVQQIFIFAEKAEPEPAPNLLYISLGNLGPLSQEWFVLILAEALIYGVLEKSGYVVLEAGNGLEALEVSRKYPDTVDLLLTDVVMPKMGGRELAGYLASLYPAIKVLYISGSLMTPW